MCVLNIGQLYHAFVFFRRFTYSPFQYLLASNRYILVFTYETVLTVYFHGVALLQVEVSRGSGLYLSKPVKAKMIVECNNDPYKMARMLLVHLFGGAQIKKEGISAMGKGKEMGIEEPYLLAMYG